MRENFEGMIVYGVPKKPVLPFDLLATTEIGEKAYYVPSSVIPTKGDEDVECKSREGDDWFPVVTKPQRLTAFLPGNPGAGKSYLANELIRLVPPHTNVLLFTALEGDDGNFAQLKREGRLFKVRMDAEMLKNMTLDTIRSRSPETLLLFDDVDAIRDPTLAKEVFKLMEDALFNGRGHACHDGRGDIHVIATSHALNDYRKTKYTLENADYVAVFPQSTTYKQLLLLFTKIGLSKELCDKVVKAGKNGVRRVIIKKSAPMYIIIGSTISLL